MRRRVGARVAGGGATRHSPPGAAGDIRSFASQSCSADSRCACGYAARRPGRARTHAGGVAHRRARRILHLVVARNAEDGSRAGRWSRWCTAAADRSASPTCPPSPPSKAATWSSGSARRCPTRTSSSNVAPQALAGGTRRCCAKPARVLVTFALAETPHPCLGRVLCLAAYCARHRRSPRCRRGRRPGRRSNQGAPFPCPRVPHAVLFAPDDDDVGIGGPSPCHPPAGCPSP